MRPLLDGEVLARHKRQNALHSGLLLTALGALLALSGFLVMGWLGLAWAMVAIGVMLLVMPKLPPEMLMRMYRARQVVPQPGDQLSEIVDILAERAELPRRPALYVVPSLAINAFAAGKPEHATVAITEGLLRQLTLREIAGVLAHEISHIRNNDLAVMGVADAVTRVTQSLSFVAILLAAANLWGLLQGEQYASWLAIAVLYLTPATSNLMQLALSRTREYDADLEAAELTGDPLALASALKRIENHTGRAWEDVMLPAPGRRVAYPSLLRSHPPTQERVQRLISLAAPSRLPKIVLAERPLVSLVGFGPVSMRPRVRFPGLYF